MTGAVRTDPLERRYRRLLGCYPADYRARYDEEMIGVLMSASAPEQRRPDPREALNLVASGLRTRLRMAASGVRTPAWRAAFIVFAYLGAAAITAISTYSQIIRGDDPYLLALVVGPHWSRGGIALSIGWALVALAVALGRTRIAAIGAALDVVGQLTVVALLYPNNPAAVVNEWWRVVLAIFAAAALLAVFRGPAREPAATGTVGDETAGGGTAGGVTAFRFPLGVRARIAVGVCVLLVGAWPIIEGWNEVSKPVGADMWEVHQRITLPVYPLTDLLMIVTYAVIVLRLAPAVRRRVVLLAAPAVATLAMVYWTFGGYLAFSPRSDPPVYPVVPQWIGLVAVPLLVWAVGLGMLRRYERKLTTGELLA
jgi:hypothetical protein